MGRERIRRGLCEVSKDKPKKNGIPPPTYGFLSG